MMEPELAAQAEQERLGRVARHNRSLQERRESLYQAHPKLRELDHAFRMARVGLVSGGFDTPEQIEAARLDAERFAAEREVYLSTAQLAPEAERSYCGLCGDAGWTGGQPCQCLKSFYTPLQKAALCRDIDIRHQTFRLFALSLFRDELLEGERYTPRQLMTEARDMAKEYAETFGTHRRNLFINGGVGTGKTFLSACVLSEVNDGAFWAEYVTSIRFLQWAEAEQFGRAAPDGRGFRRFTRCDLLVLDDLGTEYLSPFAQSALYDLVNTRLQQGRCTIVTSNLTDEQLGERYLPQTASRLRGEYELMYLHGEDVRITGHDAD